MSPNFRLGLVIALVAVVVDQASKWWVLLDVMVPPRIIPVAPFFNIVLTWNRGVSFGLFNNDGNSGAWIFSILALIVILILLLWLRKANSPLVAASLGSIIGGAVGNVIDRVVHLAVMDFLDFFIGEIHWPAFNAADSFITVGALILIFDSLFPQNKTKAKLSDDKGSNN